MSESPIGPARPVRALGVALFRGILEALSKGTSCKSACRSRYRPLLEQLEDRSLPSVSALSVAPDIHVLGATPAAGSTLPAGYSPAQIAHAYGFNQITFNNGTIKGDGTGQTIAIVDCADQPNIASDLATFDAMYGLPAPPSFIKVNGQGGTTYPAPDANWGLEISLDVEWAHAMAPGANILLVEAVNGDWLSAVNYARSQPGVAVVSMSFGSNEWSTESSFDSYFTTPAGHSGVTFVAASGDSGSSGAPEYPSVSPNVLGVGGTNLSTDSLGNYISESGWSGSGGGLSTAETQPTYQAGLTIANGNSTISAGGMRASPDVAYDGSGSSPFAIYDTSFYSGWLQVYGTSAGAPQWAALIAIANQGRALNGLTALDGVGQTLPMVYQLPQTDFHDITSGSNGTPNYTAGTGYDLVTGRGTPQANLIAQALAGNPAPPPTNNQPPTVTTPAGATLNASQTQASLSVLGSDPSGANLTLNYNWAVTSAPSGPMPTFSGNNSSTANNTTATFYQAGSYTFTVTISDTNGSTTSSVSVTVNQNETTVKVTPGSTSLSDGTSYQFSATAYDQFGNTMTTQPTFTWSLNGSGTLSTMGAYTAPSSGSGTATIQANGGPNAGIATASYGSAPAAPSNLTAVYGSASRSVRLGWQDNSTNETGFVVQRQVNGGSWSTIATLGPGVTTYTDTTANGKKKTFTYRVYSYNSYGNSAYSNTAKVTTTFAEVVGSSTTAAGDLYFAALPDNNDWDTLQRLLAKG